MPRSISSGVFLCGLLAAAAGCQRGPGWDLAPVEGTVTRDGRPLCGIEVVFLPDTNTEGLRSAGVTDEAGRYRLRTDGGGGATAGKFRVCLTDTYRAAGALIGLLAKEAEHSEDARRKLAELKAAAVAPRVPGGYNRANETPLRAEVRPRSPGGPQTVDFQLP